MTKSSAARTSNVTKGPSKEFVDRIRQFLNPLSPDDRRDVLGAIHLSLDAIVSMPTHTRIRPDASARQSILLMHFELLDLSHDLEPLSQGLATLTPRDLTNILERMRTEGRIRELLLLAQRPPKARLGILIAIQAYLETIISLSHTRADASALQSILEVWSQILGVTDKDPLESLAKDVAIFTPQDAADFLVTLRVDFMEGHVDDNAEN
jgi:hypothetical protein